MALLLLLSKRKRAVNKSLARRLSIDSIATELTRAMNEAILEARQLSGLKGVKRLVRELESLGINTSAARIKTVTEANLLRDAAAARRTASSYVRAWRSKAIGKTTGEAARAADTATNAALHRIGVTESSQAYGNGRTEAVKTVSQSGPVLYRIYDAVLDKRTCFSCAGSDGDIVGIRERFKRGEPGTIHPNCRCTWSLLSEHEVNSGYLIQAA